MSDYELQRSQQQLVALVGAHGVRVSHRNSHMSFDEKNATMLLCIVQDLQSGIAVGDKVWINGNRLSPWTTDLRGEALRDSNKFNNKMFTVLAFFRMSGKISDMPFEGTFCALQDGTFDDVCMGQEVGQTPKKVMLYWTGCMTRVQDIARPEVKSQEQLCREGSCNCDSH